MGKTPKPLRILCVGIWGDEFVKLADQGHQVDDANTLVFDDGRAEFSDYDLILGPTCHRMDEAHRRYLSLAIAEARRVRYPKGA